MPFLEISFRVVAQTVIAFGISMLSTGISCAASNNSEKDSASRYEAFAVVKKIIEADFVALDGGGERLDNVVYADFTAPDYGDGTKPGYYTLDWDEFYVAENWQLLSETVVADGVVEFAVAFEVIGHVPAGGAKNVVSDVRTLVFPYRAKRTLQGWKVDNPQVPVVGVKPLEGFYLGEKERFSKKIDAMRKRGVAPHQNLLNGLELANRRLDDIRKIMR